MRRFRQAALVLRSLWIPRNLRTWMAEIEAFAVLLSAGHGRELLRASSLERRLVDQVVCDIQRVSSGTGPLSR